MFINSELSEGQVKFKYCFKLAELISLAYDICFLMHLASSLIFLMFHG